MATRRQIRTEIGNQGEENVKFILSGMYRDAKFLDTDGQGGHPDLYFQSSNGRVCIEVKSMLPFSINKNKKKKKYRSLGYTHLSRAEWSYMGEYARSHISAMCIVIEVRLNMHPHLYFVLSRDVVNKWIEEKVSPESVWIDIPLWYIFEKGYGLVENGILDYEPVETGQTQIGDEIE